MDGQYLSALRGDGPSTVLPPGDRRSESKRKPESPVSLLRATIRPARIAAAATGVAETYSACVSRRATSDEQIAWIDRQLEAIDVCTSGPAAAAAPSPGPPVADLRSSANPRRNGPSPTVPRGDRRVVRNTDDDDCGRQGA
jgi:hypothetical protein